MKNIVKETIIILLVILLSMLIFAVVLYDFVPNKIQSKETATYSATEDVKALLQDSVAQESENIILTYEVTSTDLTNYEKAKEYVPGKQNPFEVYTEKPSESDTNTTNTTDSSSGTKENNTTSGNKSTANTSTNTSGSYFKNTGTK